MNENIYNNQIIERSKKTDHTSPIEDANCKWTARNPLCGDKVTVQLMLDGEVIQSMAYQVKGCLLCKASCAILAELSQGLTLDDLKTMGSDLDQALTSSGDNPDCFPEMYRIFYPVRLHKSRHSCVLLPFEAVIKAISEYSNSTVME